MGGMKINKMNSIGMGWSGWERPVHKGSGLALALLWIEEGASRLMNIAPALVMQQRMRSEKPKGPGKTFLNPLISHTSLTVTMVM